MSRKKRTRNRKVQANHRTEDKIIDDKKPTQAFSRLEHGRNTVKFPRRLDVIKR